MTLSDIQTLIKSRAKKQCFNDALQSALIATTELELIEAGLSAFEWAYQSGVVDDTLLSEFTEANLNTYGIYTTGTPTITNPVTEIYIIKNANATISVNDKSKIKVVSMGTGVAAISVSNDSYCKVKSFDKSIVTATISGNSVVNIDSRDNSVIDLSLNDDSLIELTAKGRSAVSAILNDTSFMLAYLYQNTTLLYELLDTSSAKITKYQSANIINKTPEV